MKWRHSFLILFLMISVQALADIGPGIRIRIIPDNPEVYPTVGATYTGNLELTTVVARDIVSPQLIPPDDGSGAYAWTVESFSIPEEVMLGPNDLQMYPFTLTCNDPTQPIELHYTVNGSKFVRSWFLLPQSITSAINVDEEVGGAAVAGDPALMDARHPGLPEVGERTGAGKRIRDCRNGAPDGDPAKAYNIRIRGRFTYRQPYSEGGQLLGADGFTVRIMDEDDNADDLLAQVGLGPSGEFDVTFSYDQSEDPDIYVNFFARNSKIDLVHPDVFENTWEWNTGILDDFEGTYHNFGTYSPGTGYDPCLHIMATLTKGWRWHNDYGGGGIDDVDVWWPSGEGKCYYQADWEHIHITAEKQWRESTALHEYGHHWMDHFSDTADAEYCNPGGRHDDPGEDCGHGMWCRETEFVAWSEGIADWFGDVPLRSNHFSGINIIRDRNAETLQRCDEGPPYLFDNPYETEGALAALLRDIEDSTQDTDTGISSLGQDRLALGPLPIIIVADHDKPLTTTAFLFAFLNRYPEHGENFWFTAKNNGMETDSGAPGMAFNLLSTTHSINVSSPKQNMAFWWQHAPDDLSGVTDYGVSLTSAPSLPSQSVNTNTNTIEFKNVNAGSWYLNVRAKDRAGHWSNSYASIGPFIIREPYPADLAAEAGGGYPYGCTPDAFANATNTYAPIPGLLVGNNLATYLNINVSNTGELPTTDNPDVQVELDGVPIWGATILDTSPIQGGSFKHWYNLGPYFVRGGRHSLTLTADVNEEMPEANPADNFEARQWSWTSRIVAVGPAQTFAPPPDPLVGIESVPLWGGYNSDGLRLNTSGAPFGGMFVWADRLMLDDFDIRLHDKVWNATTGYTVQEGHTGSFKPVGMLDGVMISQLHSGSATWDISVVNANEAPGYYWAQNVLSEEIDISLPLAVSMSNTGYEDEFAKLYHIDYSAVATPVPASIRITTNPATGPMTMVLYDHTMDFANLDDGMATAVTDSVGEATIHFQPAQAIYGLLVYRDPMDAGQGKNKATVITAQIDVFPSPPDAAPNHPPGWYSALVPRPALDGTPSTVSAPIQLFGDSPSTYFNIAFQNIGANSISPQIINEQFVDGVLTAGQAWFDVIPGAQVTYNDPSAHTIQGGRHTLSLLLDSALQVTELSEINNFAGQQWVWSPMVLDAAADPNRGSPPDPTGGWADVLAGLNPPTAMFYNCDGLRIQPGTAVNHWIAAAAMPDTGGDVDLRLHEASAGPQDGFHVPRSISSWPKGSSDYVLVSFFQTPFRDFDIGVVSALGNSPYLAEYVVSAPLTADAPSGTYGPFGMGSTNILKLHEVHLLPGHLSVTVENLSDNVDLGVTLHHTSFPYQSKSMTTINPTAWIDGAAGDNEVLFADVDQEGDFCLAVWKVGADDLPQNVNYNLIFEAVSSVDNPGDTPVIARSQIRNIAPNPMNPQATIQFDLADPDRAEVAVYDLSGRLVRTLFAEAGAAGTHSVVWNGMDERGSPAASGVYYVRLKAGRVTDVAKVTLLK